MHTREPIHIRMPASSHDPRNPPPPIPGVVFHYGPDLHPDDVEVFDGMRCTSAARTIIDLAEDLDADELLEVFHRAWEMGQLDLDRYAASRGRVEWRSSLAMLDEVYDRFRAEIDA